MRAPSAPGTSTTDRRSKHPMRAIAPLSALIGTVAVLAAGCAGLAGGPAATRAPAPVEPPTDAVKCTQPPTTGSYPYPGGPGATEQPHLLPDAWLVGLDNSDRVQQLPGDLLVVQRDGSSIAALQLEPADDGSWWIAAYAACGDLGIELDWPPAPIPTDVPDLAELECDDTSTRVLTPFVRARADGVHLHFRNTGSTWIGYAHPYGGGGARDGGEETTT